MITIFGYGLGLGTEDSSTLVSTNLEEYQGVMKFALKLWIWACSLGRQYAFQITSKVIDEEVIIPLPRSLIPRAE